MLPHSPLSPQPLATTDLFVATVLPFPERPMLEVMQCVPLSAWALGDLHLSIHHVFLWTCFFFIIEVTVSKPALHLFFPSRLQ